MLHIITLLLITRLSDWVNERTLVSMLQAVWTLPCVIALAWWKGTVIQAWPTYAIVQILLSYPYCHAIVVAWVSRNSNNVGTRSVSAALYNVSSTDRSCLGQRTGNILGVTRPLTPIFVQMSVQLGNIASSFIYRDDDKPVYRRGNMQLVAINLAAIAVFLLTKACK